MSSIASALPRETPRPPAQGYTFGDFTLDVPTYQLLRDGEVVALTVKAFDTLLFLIGHRDRVVGREELMNGIWPDSAMIEDNLIKPYRRCAVPFRTMRADRSTSPRLRAAGIGSSATLLRFRAPRMLPIPRRPLHLQRSRRSSLRRLPFPREAAAFGLPPRWQPCSPPHWQFCLRHGLFRTLTRRHRRIAPWCSHHANDPVAMDKYTTIVTWHVQQLANFAKKLAETPDGDGSLLDHSLLYFGSGMSNGNQHDRFTPPTVLLGGANGRLKGNNHVRMENREPAANVLLNIAEIFDVMLDKIGPSTARLPI
jgi:hypothetical protein